MKKYNGEQKKFYTLALLLLERTTAFLEIIMIGY